jgi:hemoglobin-like flavoprotein
VVYRREAACRAHFKFGIKAEHYKHLSDAIVATMEASLGEAWDEEQEDAWGAFMGLLMTVVGKAYAGGALPRLLPIRL